VVEEARVLGLLSDEHFSVDGTLIEAWASQKSFQQKDREPEGPSDSGNASIDFHGEKRTNDSHESTTDPDAQLYRKGKGKEANGPSGLLVHQSGPDSREAFSAWLHSSDGQLVRLRTPEGAAYTGRIFRVKMCFGRGLLLVSAVLNIRTKDKVQVEVQN
jgi:hypothetical protein